jgi:hypothetical protein
MVDNKLRTGHTCSTSENPAMSANPKTVDVLENQRAVRLARIARKMSRDLGLLTSVKAALRDLRLGRVRRAKDIEQEFATTPRRP